MGKIFVLFCFVFTFFSASAQKNVVSKNHKQGQWKKVDNLLEQNKSRAAVIILDSIYRQGLTNNEHLDVFKSQLYLLKVLIDTNGNDLEELINESEKYSKKEPFPYNAIWQSITAQLYWTYYQNNRIKILKNPGFCREITNEDIAQWSAERFFDKTATLYMRSLSHSDGLKNIDISKFSDVLTGGASSTNLRPKLLDFLVYRALDFFDTDEKDLNKSTANFTIDDPNAFAPAIGFINQKFATNDFTSYQWLSLQWYKQLLLCHETDSIKDAYVDADLHRLAFVYEHAIIPNKEMLYLQALQYIEENFAENPYSAIASYTIAKLWLGIVNDSVIVENIFKKDYQDNKPDLNRVTEKLENTINKFPKSEGAIKSKALLNIINKIHFTFESEKVLLPNEPSKILVTYRNLEKVWIRVVQMSNSEYREKRLSGQRSWYESLLRRKRLCNFFMRLPSYYDHYEHSTEIIIDSLPTGDYAIFLSSKPDFSKDSGYVQLQFFQVSNLCHLATVSGIEEPKNYVLNRKTGEPMNKVQISKFKINSNRNSYIKTKSKEDGSFKFNHHKSDALQSYYIITKLNDTLLADCLIAKPLNSKKGDIETFFYTDTKVYHPGQQIYLNGLVVNKSNPENYPSLVQNERTKINLKSCRGVLLRTFIVKTNSYGAFHIDFTIPDKTPNDTLIFENETGKDSVILENITEPKFSVSVDPLRFYYAVNENVKITGTATGLLGSKISGAIVKYQVVRTTDIPDWNNFSSEQPINNTDVKIASGSLQTDHSGNFSFTFKTVPDGTNLTYPNCVYNFNFTIEVMDINGESHTISRNFNVGNSTIQITPLIKDILLPAQTDSILVKTGNYNGKFSATKLHIKVLHLKTPDKYYRKRLWKTPDEFTMDRESFRQFFPIDEYLNENDCFSWEKDSLLIDTFLYNSENGLIVLPHGRLTKSGWYVIEFIAKDKKGRISFNKKYFQIINPTDTSFVCTPLLAILSKDSITTGDSVQLLVQSTFDKTYLIQAEQSRGLLMEKENAINNRQRRLSLNLTAGKDSKGGLLFSFLTLKDNRFYDTKCKLGVPWNNKKLDIKLDSISFKGGKAEFDLDINSKDSSIATTELIAAVSDESLDDNNQNDWQLLLKSKLFPNNEAKYEYYSGFLPTPASNLFNAPQTNNKLDFPDVGYSKLILLDDIYRGGNSEEKIIEEKTKYATELPLISPNVSESMNKRKKHRKNDELNFDKTSDIVRFMDRKSVQKNLPKSTYYITSNAYARIETKNLMGSFGLNKIHMFDGQPFYQVKSPTDSNKKFHFIYNFPQTSNRLKFRVLAYDDRLSLGFLDLDLEPKNDLIVKSDLPEFAFQGDQITINSTVLNRSHDRQRIIVGFEVKNAITKQPIDFTYSIKKTDSILLVEAEKQVRINWNFKISDTIYDPLIITISAKTNDDIYVSESTIPVLVNKNLVHKSYTFDLIDDSEKKYEFILSKSGKHYLKSTLFSVSDIKWFAIDALKNRKENFINNNVQSLIRYFNSSIAAHLYPSFENELDSWQTMDSFLSDKSVYRKLKNSFSDEIPYFFETKKESETKKEILEYFNDAKVANSNQGYTKEIKKLQSPCGGFPWYSGMTADRYLSQLELSTLGKVLSLEKTKNNDVNEIVGNGLNYIDRELKKDYDYLVKNKANFSKKQIDEDIIQYFYARSYFIEYPIPKNTINAYNFYLEQALHYYTSFNENLQYMLAISFKRTGHDSIAHEIIHNIETIKKNKLLKQQINNNNYSNNLHWINDSIIQNSLSIEAQNEIIGDTESVIHASLFLINKYMQNAWKTPIEHLFASYALVLAIPYYKKNESLFRLILNTDTLINFEHEKYGEKTLYVNQEYFMTHTLPVKSKFEIESKLHKNVNIWSKIELSYFDSLRELQNTEKHCSIKRELMVSQNSAKGIVQKNVKDSIRLKVGDKVTVKLEITSDQDLEYIHIKDIHAACFRTSNYYNGFIWKNGFGYYETTTDATNNFFVDYLKKGKYTFEYPVYVVHSGVYSLGCASLQCLFSPEIADQTTEENIKVIEK